MPGWSTQRGRELGDIKDVDCIGFGDLNVNDEGRSGNPPWIIYAYIHIYRHTHMAWVIVGDDGGATYPKGGGNFLFTFLMFSLYVAFSFWLYFYKLVEFETEKVKTA